MGQNTMSMQKLSDLKSEVLGATAKITQGHGRKTPLDQTPVVTIPNQKNSASYASAAISFFQTIMQTQPDDQPDERKRL
jgi:hypothetical protein